MSFLFNSTPYPTRLESIVSAKGIYLTDDNGRQFMDLESGVWCTSLGHNHPGINAVIADQLKSVSHAGFCYNHPEIDDAAESVVAITGLENGKAVFLCSGSEGIEFSRQAARHMTGHPRSMTLHDSYLGSYSSVTNRGAGWFLFNWEACASCLDQHQCRKDCDLLKTVPDTISDFVFEPGSSSGFVRFPPKTMIQNLVDIVRANGGKVIINEVTTGIGRTGKWLGHHHYDIRPDMIALGKGLGNGYPVSAAILSHDTAELLSTSGFRYMQSHQNDPMGAVIARQVISVIQNNDLISAAAEKGERFLALLETLRDGSIVTDVRGRGLMFGMDISDIDTGNRIFEGLIEKGFIICNRNGLFRIDPPLMISDEEFAFFVEAFESVKTACRNTVTALL